MCKNPVVHLAKWAKTGMSPMKFSCFTQRIVINFNQQTCWFWSVNSATMNSEAAKMDAEAANIYGWFLHNKNCFFELHIPRQKCGFGQEIMIANHRTWGPLFIERKLCEFSNGSGKIIKRHGDFPWDLATQSIMVEGVSTIPFVYEKHQKEYLVFNGISMVYTSWYDLAIQFRYISTICFCLRWERLDRRYG